MLLGVELVGAFALGCLVAFLLLRRRRSLRIRFELDADDDSRRDELD